MAKPKEVSSPHDRGRNSTLAPPPYTLFLMDPASHTMSEGRPAQEKPHRRALTSIGQGWTGGDSVWFQSTLNITTVPSEATLYLVVEATEKTLMDGLITVGGRNPKPACTWVVRWTFADFSKDDCHPQQLSVYEPGSYNVTLPFAGVDQLDPASLPKVRVEIMAAASTSWQSRPTLFLLSGATGAESRLEFGFPTPAPEDAASAAPTVV